MRKMKAERGVTLVALTITVIILLIVSSILIYNANDNIQIKRLTSMYNDVSNLRDKVASYYKEYGAIPAKIEYTAVSHLKDAGVIGANDGDKFYVLDLERLDGVTLNFGKDYEKVRKQQYTDINQLKDLYIINEKSHNIFYVEGIQVKDNDTIKIFYTDDENIDKVKVPIFEKTPNTPDLWTATTKRDPEWYSYNDLENNKENVNVNEPVLKGEMTPIKYTGPGANTEEQRGSKWANAITADGSMWVWIPRYAYKITEGYHTNQAGTIEVAFLDTNNKFLNGETGEITTNIEDPEAGLTKWLVHPAFTNNAEYGGGFGEIPGLWVGKFETTGEYTEGDATKVSVKPGVPSLRNMTVNQQYKAGMDAKYGESVNLNSHMMKNTEWGATIYLAYSKYGTNKLKVEQNESSLYYTGGTNTVEQIYVTNKRQSTTHNATGVYDLNGGSWERVASYVNNGNINLETYAGKVEGDLYGATREEQGKSTKHKKVYDSLNNQEKDYILSGEKNNGDAIYETSGSHAHEHGSWNTAYAYFPLGDKPFFSRGGGYRDTATSIFYFGYYSGEASIYHSFRQILIPNI